MLTRLEGSFRCAQLPAESPVRCQIHASGGSASSPTRPSASRRRRRPPHRDDGRPVSRVRVGTPPAEGHTGRLKMDKRESRLELIREQLDAGTPVIPASHARGCERYGIKRAPSGVPYRSSPLRTRRTWLELWNLFSATGRVVAGACRGHFRKAGREREAPRPFHRAGRLLAAAAGGRGAAGRGAAASIPRAQARKVCDFLINSARTWGPATPRSSFRPGARPDANESRLVAPNRDARDPRGLGARFLTFVNPRTTATGAERHSGRHSARSSWRGSPVRRSHHRRASEP